MLGGLFASPVSLLYCMHGWFGSNQNKRHRCCMHEKVITIKLGSPSGRSILAFPLSSSFSPRPNNNQPTPVVSRTKTEHRSLSQ